MENETVSIEELLKEQYRQTLEGLSETTFETDEAIWELKKLNELGKQYQLMTQTNSETAAKKEESILKMKQAKEGRVERWVTIFINGAAVFLPILVSSHWMSKGLRFEEGGTFTSKTANWIGGITRLFKK